MQHAMRERRPSRRTITQTRILAVMAVAVMFALPQVASAAQLGSSVTARGHRSAAAPMSATLLADGLQGTVGATIGPDGALYVVEAVLGQVTRIDPSTGDATSFPAVSRCRSSPRWGDRSRVRRWHAVRVGDAGQRGCRRE